MTAEEGDDYAEEGRGWGEAVYLGAWQQRKVMTMQRRGEAEARLCTWEHDSRGRWWLYRGGERPRRGCVPGSMTAEEGDDYAEEDEAEIDFAAHLTFWPESLNLKINCTITFRSKKCTNRTLWSAAQVFPRFPAGLTENSAAKENAWPFEN
jgi:hypothetical protein